MAGTLPKFTSTLVIFCTILLLSNAVTDGESHQFYRSLCPKKMGLKQEKLSHLHFYFHDVVTGLNPTCVRVAEAPTTNTSETWFGAVVVIDDPLTEGPEPSSKLVGRAQGTYTLASQNEVGVIMAMTFAFMEGKFKGSTFSILGRNMVLSNVREMPIVGGSGLFRFARGYVQAKTHILNFETKNAIVEYNVYVLHY
ncbi:hypothetical protein HHK36_012049 [Tetracentron sinense]|uniref:Dirigent protein n=1 Tax=Tetracentron sinense TaxID=13715 RepID=A0A834ZJQ7_TETSI|nr:hypothetical protein HHK36_012049 [Tetracentron sinense]